MPKYLFPTSLTLWTNKLECTFQIQITDPKMLSAPTKTGASYNFCFIKFSPNQMVEAAEAHQTLFRAPPDPGGWGMGANPSYKPFPH